MLMSGTVGVRRNMGCITMRFVRKRLICCVHIPSRMAVPFRQEGLLELQVVKHDGRKTRWLTAGVGYSKNALLGRSVSHVFCLSRINCIQYSAHLHER